MEAATLAHTGHSDHMPSQRPMLQLDQRTHIDEDRTPLSKVKKYYYPIPPRSSLRAEPSKKPGANITPREWQALAAENTGSYGAAPLEQNESLELTGAFHSSVATHTHASASTYCQRLKLNHT